MTDLIARAVVASSSPTQTSYLHTITPTFDAPAAAITTGLIPGTYEVPEENSTLCTIALPAGGYLWLNESYYTVLADTITFESPCANQTIHDCPNGGLSNVVKSDDEFYASVPTQVYVLAIATVISYVLLALLFITPRTFYTGGPRGTTNLSSLRSLVPGSHASNVIGVGRRPLLQKIAVLTVVVSLTIASADTFKVAEDQYNSGIMDSLSLVDEVLGSVEIRVIRVISDTFLWLAQVQTLIRLFPRHKEKVTIKWLGFALVTCDTVFSILENFISQSTLTRPKIFQDAIPALSYLFQMAISLIYASCVIYYSFSKHRFPFYHPKMKNIILLAVISIAAILVPVVFFVTDVASPKVATWGEYIRWVGAAAASVVVWEWVERIEALERDERKDGILGREIFDGDEMLDMGSDGKSSSTSNYFGFGTRSSSNGEKKVSILPLPPLRPYMHFRRKPAPRTSRNKKPEIGADGTVITNPQNAITPASRTDTTSPASTVYQVRYQNVSSPSPVIPEETTDAIADAAAPNDLTRETTTVVEDEEPEEQRPRMWQSGANPFKRKRAEPPAEVAAQLDSTNSRRSPAQTYNNLRHRITSLASRRQATRQRQGPSPPIGITVIPAQPRPGRNSVAVPQADQQSQRSSRSSGSRRAKEDLPVTIIPPPVRGGRTWSPDDLDNMPQQPPTPDPNLIARGSLTIADSPVRRSDSRSTPPSNSRTGTRLRAPTIDSLNDRISSTSPSSAAAHSNMRSSPLQHTDTPDNAANTVIPEVAEEHQGQILGHSDAASRSSPDVTHRDNG